MKLETQRYGKSHVRVMKVIREGDVHHVKELDIEVLLEGDFESAYTAGENGLVVPTDTMKNTVNVLAYRHLEAETERFAVLLARHFVEKYSQVEVATVMASERVWGRMEIGGEPHPHSFIQSDNAKPTARARYDGRTAQVESGMEDLLILKSTGSGFEGFPRCEYTTLPETSDRILATSLRAVWEWSSEPADYSASNRDILRALMGPFASNYSPSVQATLFEMGSTALRACPEISAIRLAMPNQHCNLINLSPFGIENRNELFVPTDEPHGQIEARVVR